MMKSFLLSILFLGINFFSILGFCSDHVDGPITTSMPIKDISDLYVFQTPEKKDSISVVLNVRPFALAKHHFDPKVYYRIVFRKAQIDYVTRSIPTDPTSEIILTCRFGSAPSSDLAQAHCKTNHGLQAVADFNSINFDKYLNNDFRLYIGFRADPFFIDKDFTSAFMNDLKIAPQTKNNIMTKLNVLTLVMDIPVAKLFPPQPQAEKPLNQKASKKIVKNNKKNAAPTDQRKPANSDDYLIAVAAESISTDPDKIWDVVGRPEITNVTMHARKGMTDLRDKFNKPQRSFNNYNSDRVFFDRIYNNIQTYDMIDGQQDFNPNQLKDLALMLVNDYLVIDPFSTDCEKSSFFALERAALLGKKSDSCGGRDLNDHFLDFLFTTYVKGLSYNHSTVISDGLSGPEKPISKVFPYLNEPTTGLSAYLKATAAQMFPP